MGLKLMSGSKTGDSWTAARRHVPVDIFPHEMFQRGWDIHSDLNYAEKVRDDQEAYERVLKANKELSKLVNTIQSSLDEVYKDAKNYRSASKAFYRLIDMNLRFYRYAEIDQVLGDVTNTHGEVNRTELYNLIQNLQRLEETLKESIQDASQQFEKEKQELSDEEKEEHSPEVVFMVAFAQQLESRLRYSAKHVSGMGDETGLEDNGDGGGIKDYYAVIERAESSADATEKMEDKIKEESEEFMDEAEEEIRHQFDEELA